MTYMNFSTPRRRRYDHTTVLFVLAVFAIIAAIGFGAYSYKTSERSVTFTVEDKDRVCSGSSNGNSSCKYLIFTDQGTFKLTDSLLYGRFNTSDVYGRIKKDHVYDARVVGWRVPVLSRYPNIISVEDHQG